MRGGRTEVRYERLVQERESTAARGKPGRGAAGLASSIVESSLDWRWVFWVMMIFAGVCTLAIIVMLPETYAPVLLQRKVSYPLVLFFDSSVDR